MGRPLLDLLNIRDSDNVTPRLDELQRRENIEEHFESGEIPDIDLERVEDLPVKEAGIIDEITGSSVEIKSGRAETGEDPGWYGVTFDDAFNGRPVVIPTITHREGEFSSESFGKPSSIAPSQSMFASKIDLSDEIEKNFKDTSRDTGSNLFLVGEDAFSALPDIVANEFIDAWDFLMTEVYGEGRREKDGEGFVESAMGALGQFLGTQIEDAFKKRGDEIEKNASQANENFEIVTDSSNEAFKNLSSQSESALNKSPKLLYDSIGMPEGAMMSPANIRNVDASGFEVLGLKGGMEVQWVAIGRSSGDSII